jgi:hypothetical protein
LVVTPGDFFVRYDRLEGQPSYEYAFSVSIRVTVNLSEVNSDILFIFSSREFATCSSSKDLSWHGQPLLWPWSCHRSAHNAIH